MQSITKTFILSRYEPQEYGIGHSVDGDAAGKDAAFSGGLNGLFGMIKSFGNLPTGTEIIVTMKAREEVGVECC